MDLRKFKSEEVHYQLPDGELLPIIELSLQDRNKLFQKIRNNIEDPLVGHAYMVLACCPHYSLDSEDDLKMILESPSWLIEDISDFASKHNAWTDEEREDQKKTLKVIQS